MSTQSTAAYFSRNQYMAHTYGTYVITTFHNIDIDTFYILNLQFQQKKYAPMFHPSK